MAELTVHSVLAAAYGGRNPSPKMLARGVLHASFDGGETALCRRVVAGNLSNDAEHAPPTCPVCIKRLAIFVRIPGHPPRMPPEAPMSAKHPKETMAPGPLAAEARRLVVLVDAYDNPDVAVVLLVRNLLTVVHAAEDVFDGRTKARDRVTSLIRAVCELRATYSEAYPTPQLAAFHEVYKPVNALVERAIDYVASLTLRPKTACVTENT